MNKLQQHYDKLTDLERFRLVMAAFERDDDAEVRALQDTAPKANYRMTKWEYKQMFTALEWATLYVTQGILFHGFLSALGWGLEYARPYTEDTERPPDADVMMAEKVLAKWDALALFCDELGVTREQALGLCTPPGVLEQVVDFAEVILEGNESLMQIFTDVHCKETGQDAEAMNAERTANVAERRQAAAHAEADVLRQIWEHRVGD